MSEGKKKDEGKLPWDLLPYDAVEAVVDVLKFGQAKYDARNWEKGIKQGRLFAAAQRHLTAWFQKGQDEDPESGLSHLAHAACTVLFMLAFVKRNRYDLDDRPGNLVDISLEEFLQETDEVLAGPEEPEDTEYDDS